MSLSTVADRFPATAEEFQNTLVSLLASHVLPALTGIRDVPEASWEGWQTVLQQLHVDPSDKQRASATIAASQNIVAQLLKSPFGHHVVSQSVPAIASTQLHSHDHEGQVVLGLAAAADPAADNMTAAAAAQLSPEAAAAAAAAGMEVDPAQLLGSAAQVEVLAEQPKARIIAKALARSLRGDEEEVWYQLVFEGYPTSEAEWFPAARIRSDYPGGDELIAGFEAAHASGYQEQQQQQQQYHQEQQQQQQDYYQQALAAQAGQPAGTQEQAHSAARAAAPASQPAASSAAMSEPGAEVRAAAAGSAPYTTAASAEAGGWSAAGQQQQQPTLQVAPLSLPLQLGLQHHSSLGYQVQPYMVLPTHSAAAQQPQQQQGQGRGQGQEADRDQEQQEDEAYEEPTNEQVTAAMGKALQGVNKQGLLRVITEGVWLLLNSSEMLKRKRQQQAKRVEAKRRRMAQVQGTFRVPTTSGWRVYSVVPTGAGGGRLLHQDPARAAAGQGVSQAELELQLASAQASAGAPAAVPAAVAAPPAAAAAAGAEQQPGLIGHASAGSEGLADPAARAAAAPSTDLQLSRAHIAQLSPAEKRALLIAQLKPALKQMMQGGVFRLTSEWPGAPPEDSGEQQLQQQQQQQQQAAGSSAVAEPTGLGYQYPEEDDGMSGGLDGGYMRRLKAQTAARGMPGMDPAAAAAAAAAAAGHPGMMTIDPQQHPQLMAAHAFTYDAQGQLQLAIPGLTSQHGAPMISMIPIALTNGAMPGQPTAAAAAQLGAATMLHAGMAGLPHYLPGAALAGMAPAGLPMGMPMFGPHGAHMAGAPLMYHHLASLQAAGLAAAGGLMPTLQHLHAQQQQQQVVQQQHQHQLVAQAALQPVAAPAALADMSAAGRGVGDDVDAVAADSLIQMRQRMEAAAAAAAAAAAPRPAAAVVPGGALTMGVPAVAAVAAVGHAHLPPAAVVGEAVSSVAAVAAAPMGDVSDAAAAATLGSAAAVHAVPAAGLGGQVVPGALTEEQVTQHALDSFAAMHMPQSQPFFTQPLPQLH